LATKSVLQRYKDSKCRTLDTGSGVTQAWLQTEGSSLCYDLTQGYQCSYRCVFKLDCAYDTGSGVIIRVMSSTSCSGDGTSNRPFASHLYWLQAKALFQGSCTSDGSGKYIKFAAPLPDYPDCSTTGDVEPGADDALLKYEATYTLQFYKDTSCKTKYEVTTYSDRQTSTFEFNLWRGAQYCYDMDDITARDNSSSRVVDYSMLNWRFVCGNIDSVGNGIMIEGFEDEPCTGRSTGTQRWKDVFYPMNFPDTSDLLEGKCVRWGKYSAKFNSAWNTDHYPNCQSWSCSDPSLACTGGRVTDPNSDVGTIYSGSITSSGGNPAATVAAASVRRSEAGLMTALGYFLILSVANTISSLVL